MIHKVLPSSFQRSDSRHFVRFLNTVNIVKFPPFLFDFLKTIIRISFRYKYGRNQIASRLSENYGLQFQLIDNYSLLIMAHDNINIFYDY